MGKYKLRIVLPGGGGRVFNSGCGEENCGTLETIEPKKEMKLWRKRALVFSTFPSTLLRRYGG